MKKCQVEEGFRTLRTVNYRLSLLRGENKAGEFMRLMKVENGKVNSLMIPKEKDGARWSNFYVYIKGFFNNNKQKDSYIGLSREVRVGNKKDMVDSEMRKDWKKAITIFRSNTKMPWRIISTKLEAVIKRKVELSQVATDRAILWCFEMKEFNDLLLRPHQLSSNNTYVKMKKWEKEDHWENLQIGVHHSWIGIKGLPLKMWNIHVFKVIGEACGGLLEVAQETLNKLFMGYAKIKIKGFASGLMNPVIEILCEGEKVCLGAFTVRGPRGGVCGYRTAGITTRVISSMNPDEFAVREGVQIRTNEDIWKATQGRSLRLNDFGDRKRKTGQWVEEIIEESSKVNEESTMSSMLPLTRKEHEVSTLRPDRNNLGKGVMSSNDANVSLSAKKQMGVQFADLFLPNTDKVRGKMADGETYERLPLMSNTEGGCSHGKSAKVGYFWRSSTSNSASKKRAQTIAIEKDSSLFEDENRFHLLSKKGSCGSDYFQDQEFDLAKENSLLFRQQNSVMGRAHRRKKGNGVSTEVGQEESLRAKGVLTQQKAQLHKGLDNHMLTRPMTSGPTTPGCSTLLEIALLRPITTGQSVLVDTISNLEFNYSDEADYNSISPGTNSSEANSEPILKNLRDVLKGRLKNLKPKQRCEFLKACVSRWEDFTTTKGRINNKHEKVTVLSISDQDNDKDKSPKAVLKVYSRARAKSISKIHMESEMNHMAMEEIHEGSCSECEGDKQLLLQPESSSDSSFSETEESYFSDKIIEEDLDLHLQGISVMMEEHEAIVEKDQQGPLGSETSLVHTNSNVLPQPAEEGKGEKERCHLVEVDCPNKNQ